jgi:hypothetical protein
VVIDSSALLAITARAAVERRPLRRSPHAVEDIARFDEIAAASELRRSRTDAGQDVLVFTSRRNGEVVVVSAVRTGRKALALHTMYKRPWPLDAREGGAGGPAGPDALPGAPSEPRGYTSKATASTTDTDIAPAAAERQAPRGMPGLLRPRYVATLPRRSASAKSTITDDRAQHAAPFVIKG